MAQLNPLIWAIVAFAVLFPFLYTILTMRANKEAPVALKPQEYQKFKLAKITPVNHNVTIFRFSLPSPEHRVGLPVGQHMFLRFTDKDNKPISRPYTPISSDDELGYFDLLIKLYPTGKMSQHLKSMKVGDSIEIRGPSGHVHYHGHGKFEIQRKKEKQIVQAKNVGMIAGGSGITPMLQIVRAVQKDPTDHTHKSLIFGNVSVGDILLKDELDAVVKGAAGGRFKLHYCVDKAPDTPVDYEHSTGFINADLIKKHLPPPAKDSLVLLCGPKPMTDSVTKFLTENLGYTEDMFFCY